MRHFLLFSTGYILTALLPLQVFAQTFTESSSLTIFILRNDLFFYSFFFLIVLFICTSITYLATDNERVKRFGFWGTTLAFIIFTVELLSILTFLF